MRVGSVIYSLHKVHDVPPVYPTVAIAAKVEGVVIIEASIDVTGHVTETRILRSIALLDEAALDAVRQWEFEPIVVAGIGRVPIVAALSVSFRLPHEWALPATIEVLRDVPIRTEERGRQERGSLYVGEALGQVPARIRKGTRFQMTRIDSEGECVIRLAKQTLNVSSCPWLSGFADPQQDVFKVISGKARVSDHQIVVSDTHDAQGRRTSSVGQFLTHCEGGAQATPCSRLSLR